MKSLRYKSRTRMVGWDRIVLIALAIAATVHMVSNPILSLIGAVGSAGLICNTIAFHVAEADAMKPQMEQTKKP